MTDRAKGLVVVLEEDVRVDDLECVINAIKMIKMVATVTPVISGYDDVISRTRVTLEVKKKLYAFIDENLKLEEVI